MYQHFVPRFYLSYFGSANGKQISIFNTKLPKFITGASLYMQCAKENFYGNQEIESAFAELEGANAATWRSILLNQRLPAAGSREHHLLYLFILLQRLRTQAAQKRMSELRTKLDDVIESESYPERPRASRYKDIDRKIIVPIAEGLASAPQFLPHLMDLSMKVISAKGCNRRFLTSDHPVVFYNSFLEERKAFGGTCGVASKGLKIFLPMSPDATLMLFDASCYAVGSRGSTHVKAIDADVAALNALQYINCNHNLYLSDTDVRHVLALAGRYVGKRGKDATCVVECPQKGPADADGTTRSLLMNYDRDIKIGLDLSFMRITKPGRKWVPPDHMGWTRFPVPSPFDHLEAPIGPTTRYVINSRGHTTTVD